VLGGRSFGVLDSNRGQHDFQSCCPASQVQRICRAFGDLRRLGGRPDFPGLCGRFLGVTADGGLRRPFPLGARRRDPARGPRRVIDASPAYSTSPSAPDATARRRGSPSRSCRAPRLHHHIRGDSTRGSQLATSVQARKTRRSWPTVTRIASAAVVDVVMLSVVGGLERPRIAAGAGVASVGVGAGR
jgi:hypothetical protein